MSKYVTLPSTVTKTTLGLTKSIVTSPATTVPTVYTTPYHKLTTAPHISVLIHKIRTGHATSMLPYLVGRSLVPRGYMGHTKKIGSTIIPATSTIISVTSTGLITYFGYGYTGGYFGKPVHVYTFTSTMTISKLVKTLKGGSMTLI